MEAMREHSFAAMPSAITTLGRAVEDAAERIRGSVSQTPVEPMSHLVPDEGTMLFFKMENQQKTGSFKLRGASNKILSLSRGDAAKGVIAASNGNHGLGVAAAAKSAGIAAEVYVSSHVSPAKARRIEEFGATNVRSGTDPLEAEVAARAAADREERVFISPYNDFDVMAGQGTIAVELLQQLPRIDAIFLAVGGGGLIGGVGAYLKCVSPGTRVVGCWPENSRVLYESIRAGRIVEFPEQPTLSESTAGGLEQGSVTLDVCRTVIDDSVLVSEQEILDAMLQLRDSHRWYVEGAAAVAVAAFLKESRRFVGQTVVVVICGGNLSPEVRSKLSS